MWNGNDGDQSMTGLRHTPEKCLAIRHNRSVDALWRRHISGRIDPVKKFPIELLGLSFGFVVYGVEHVSLIPCLNWSAVGRTDATLSLTAVSEAWCQVVTGVNTLWNTMVLSWKRPRPIFPQWTSEHYNLTSALFLIYIGLEAFYTSQLRRHRT